VVEVRGRGLMLGCDLDDAAGDAHDVVARALGAGAVINATGAHTLRFLPPLVCEEADVDNLIEILAGVLA
jgi:acetylornithine/succinyldiaminopimelate/putrescine aminotransferase